MESNKIYKKVMNESTMVGRRSMENIKQVCDNLDKEGVVITIAVVCREIARLKLSPKGQTVRNNKLLHDYIVLRNSEQVLKEVELTGDEKLIELINQYKRENEALRKLLKNKIFFEEG